MRMPDLDTVLRVLERGGLVSTTILAEERRAADRPEALLDRLVARGSVTSWQARQLLRGATRFDLGKLTLLEALGGGGMGLVYRARHQVLAREVAVKVIRPRILANERAVRRFLREARLAATLDHAHVVRVLDADEVEGLHVLSMELVDGVDLDRLIESRGALPLPWACELCRQAAAGLQHAYERGLVHRDIKPGNVLVALDPRSGRPHVRVLDFGLAKLAVEGSRDGTLTVTGDVLGTPDFMAPEQAHDTKHADIRADLYSLGCTLYWAATGRVPFRGETLAEKLAAKALLDPPTFSSAGIDAPPELEELLRRLLSREPVDRPSSPREVAEALARFAPPAGEPPPDRLEPERAPPPPSRPAVHLDEVLHLLGRPDEAHDDANAAPPRSAAPAASDRTAPLPAGAREPTRAEAAPLASRSRLSGARTSRRGGPLALGALLAIVLVALVVLVALTGALVAPLLLGPPRVPRGSEAPSRENGGASGPKLTTPAAAPATVPAPLARLRITAEIAGSARPLEELSTVPTGALVEVRLALPEGTRPALFWLDAAGLLHELEHELVDGADGRSLIAPGGAARFPLEDPAGTELVFVVGARGDEPTPDREAVLAAGVLTRPWPRLADAGTIAFDERRDPESPDAAIVIRARELRTSLAARWSLLRAVAFPHR